jgi:hypothetical protein
MPLTRGICARVPRLRVCVRESAPELLESTNQL